MAINRTSGNPDQFWGCAACQNSYGSLIDATQDAVRTAMFDRWWAGYGTYGIRSVWFDETEPDRGACTQQRRQRSARGTDCAVVAAASTAALTAQR